MATGGSRIYPTDDMGGHAFGAGGPSMSRQSATEMFHELKSSKTLTLEEAYWTDRRRKMGLTRVSKAEPVPDDEFQKIREEQIKFVQGHFHQKECRLFIAVPGQCGNGKKCTAADLKCHCGEVLSMHDGMRERPSDKPFDSCLLFPKEYSGEITSLGQILTKELPVTNKWSPETSFTISKSNSFGKIDFNVEQIGGKKPAKYIRLCAEDSVADCLELMKKYWHIMEPEPPHLVISVVGGAKNFKLDGRMRGTFSTGLIKAAKTTKAWLITSGFNMGVQKAVGQAVHEGQTFEWENDRMTHVLRCIGIAPWGYVKGRKYLESNGSGQFNAEYRTSTQILHKQPVPLNPDHTHFIFVDDGYRIRYGGVADFRSKFERKIAAEEKDGGLGIPVVLLIVEGGTDAIQDVSASLKQGIPVVVCAGTGRAADILTYAYTHTTTTHDKTRTMSDLHREKLKYKIATAYMKEGAELEALTQKIIGCCQRENLITIFNMNKHEELDLAILSVLLKVETNSSRESQLKLALTWNRADIAQEEIFREDVIWKEGSLEDFLTQALVENKVDFVRLLLNNGIIMQEYLTVERLEHLYNAIPKHFYLYVSLKAFTKSDTFTVNYIGNFLRAMLDRYEDDKYTKNLTNLNRTSRGSFKPIKQRLAVKRQRTELDLNKGHEHQGFKRPYKQLLIWAVLMNRFELAHLFWELGEEPITSALVCTSLCLGMEWKVPKYLSAVRTSFQNMKKEFEKLAISVLDECHSTDPDKAIMLVDRKSPMWSKLTCLQIAASANDQAFVSSVACQNSINNVWKNGIISSWPKVILSALFPPFILIGLEMSMMGRKDAMTKFQKILTFYTAPLSKFCVYTLSYAAFLLLFTYMLLADYKQTPSGTEWLVLIWIVSYLVGAVYSFITFPSPTFTGTLRDYFGPLDRLEFLNLILAIIAFCVRWNHPQDGKVIYCINAVIFYVRVMKLYTANRSLGPKIYMIYRMLLELAMFVMVLMVFLLAYGVASQGLLYRKRQRDWLILKDILYFPYWQLYGEIFLEELETDDVCTAQLQASLNGTLADADNTCRTFHWLVPIMLALYLLVGNVLLLNLLIAIFSHVFDNVEKNAIEIWKFQQYFLVMEFQNRPLFMPPFSLITHVWYFVIWLYRKISCAKAVKSKQFMKHHLEFLSLFEKEMMANKLRALRVNIMQSTEMKFHVLQTRMDELARLIEDEVIAEQYGMMPTMAPADFMATRPIPTATNEINKTDNIELALDDGAGESKKKHKHKKKKKKRDREKERYDEEKQLNINLPEVEKKAVHDKTRVVSDEENRSPDLRQERTAPSSSVQSTTHITLQPLGPLRESSTGGRSTRIASQERRDLNVQSGPMDVMLDSDDDPIPLEMYSPRASDFPHLSLGTGSMRQSLSPVHSNLSDDSLDSVISFRQARRRTRRHLARRRNENDLEGRIQRAHRTSYTNSFSNDML